jgi:hypothetical protein
MGSRPTLKTENFDMDSFFDFNQGGTQPSPINPTSARPDATPQTATQDWNSLSPYDQPEERQHFNGPSHDYTQYKQQVGLPLGSIQSMPMQPQMMDGFNSGIDMNVDAGFGSGWATGIDMDADMGMDFNQPQQAAMPPPVFFSNDGPSANFVNPNTLAGQEEAGPSNVGRLWPGMHSQQAQQIAMQKAAQTQAMQQRQMKLQAQQQQYRQAANAAHSQSQGSSAPQQSHGNGKRPSHATEPHVEESISRLLNQMRHNSSVSDDAGSPDNLLPQIARMRKDEEEMDEDERLLASEEGKKLSSKERRQLRNKVSARAFRSRRKGMLYCNLIYCTNIRLTIRRIHWPTRRRNCPQDPGRQQPTQRERPHSSRKRALPWPHRDPPSPPGIHTIHQRHQRQPICSGHQPTPAKGSADRTGSPTATPAASTTAASTRPASTSNHTGRCQARVHEL